MPKISVMTLTNRYGGIDVAWNCLRRQTFDDFEWVLVDAIDRQKEVEEYVSDKRLKYIKQNKTPDKALTNLAHADNQGFANCDGELIVCLQDYIWINPTGLEKFWEAHQAYGGKILVTGVGDQYGIPAKEDITDQHGKITVFKEPYTGKPEKVVWRDPRRRLDQGTFYMCNPPDWEMNWASIPRKVVYEMGGMDEEYDFHGFAWDNVNISQRADMLGYRQYIDQTNDCMGFWHDDWWPNPLKVNRVSPQEYHLKSMKEMSEGIRPIKLDYLKNVK
jgi:glycosyltransferase involved in cell wall biosynthesis